LLPGVNARFYAAAAAAAAGKRARMGGRVSAGEPRKTKRDSAKKKRLLGLVFRNIKISDKKIKNAEFFAPFNYLIFEEKNKCRNRKIQNLPALRTGATPGSVSSLSDDLLDRLDRTLFPFLKSLYL